VFFSKRLKNNKKIFAQSKFVVSKPYGMNPIKQLEFQISVLTPWRLGGFGDFRKKKQQFSVALPTL